MNSNIKNLILKYLERTITVDEFNELEMWVLNSKENQCLFENILSDYKFFILADYTPKNINQLIESNIYKIRLRRRRKLLFTVSAAAVFALILGSISVLLLGQRNVLNETGRGDYLKSELIENTDTCLSSNKREIILSESGKNILITGDIDRKLLDGVRLTEAVADYTALSKLEKSISPNVMSSVSVPKGKNFKIILSDGTKLWINADSYVEYPSVFVGEERRINVRGEIYLEVAHNPNKPFIVNVYNSEIKVLGTKFNVSAYPESVNTITTLLEGAVVVDDTNILSPNEQLSFNKHTMKGSISKVNAAISMQWIDGIYYFDNMPLKELSTLFNRVYDIDIDIKSEDSMRKVFTGSIHKNIPLNEMFEIIMKTTNIEYVIDKERIIIW